MNLPARLQDRKGNPLTEKDGVLFDQKGVRVCGSRMPKTPHHIRCSSRMVMANGRCRMHGGPTPSGVDSPHWRGKGRTKDLPTRLAEKVEAYINDPNHLSLSTEMALLDVRLVEVMGKLDLKESEPLWGRLLGTWNQLKEAVVAGEEEKVQELMDRMDEHFQDHSTEREVWKEARDIMEDRRRLTDTERKREEFLEANVSAKQMAAFLGVVRLAILEEVQDPDQRARVALRLQRALLNGGRE